MTRLLSSRLDAVKPSPSMAAKQRVDALRAQGRHIIDFSIGEPDFPTPPHVVEAGVKALIGGMTKYTASAGIIALRVAIAAKLRNENGLTYALDQVVVGSGAKQIIHDALAATLNDGDEVIIPAPYWVSYPDMVALYGGRPVVISCPMEDGFKLRADALEAAITPRTRWLVLNSPNNPTGAVYSRDELQSLCSVLKRHPHVWLLTDEIYEHFVYGGSTHYSAISVAPELQSRSLVVNGVSKAYAMTGWRIGYGAGPKELVKAITMLLTQSTSCPASMSQFAALAALEGDQSFVSESARLFEIRRDVLVERLSKMPGIQCLNPAGAFYAFPSVVGLLEAVTPHGVALTSDLDVAMYLLEEASVATIDGSSYGMPGFLRMSFATSLDHVQAGCDAIESALKKLKFPHYLSQ